MTRADKDTAYFTLITMFAAVAFVILAYIAGKTTGWNDGLREGQIAIVEVCVDHEAWDVILNDDEVIEMVCNRVDREYQIHPQR